MARVARSKTRRLALILALLVAVMAFIMGALPILSPETFIPAEHLQAVHRFFQTASTDLDASAPHASRARVHTNNWAVLVCTSKFWFNYRVRVFSR